MNEISEGQSQVGREQSEIEREIRRCDESLDSLDSIVSALGERLGPVLGDSNPQKDTVSEAEEQPESSMGNHVRQMRYRAYGARDRIGELLSRLKL